MIDIRKEYPQRPTMAFIVADLRMRGYRLSNNCRTWYVAYRVN